MSIRRCARKDESGTSLVEMLVTIVLISIVGLAIVSTVSNVGRAANASNDRLESTTRVQFILARVSKFVRAAHVSSSSPATGFALADGNHITFTSDFGDPTGPRKVDISLSGSTTSGTVTENITLADAGSSYTYTGPVQTRLLGPIDVDTSLSPMFKFYNRAGALLATPMTTAAATSQIASVRMVLTTNEPGLAKPVTVDSLIYLRNLEYR